MKMLAGKFVLLILISATLAKCNSDKHRKEHEQIKKDMNVTSPIQQQSIGISEEANYLYNKLFDLLMKGLKGLNDFAEFITHYVEDGELEDKVNSVLQNAITYVKSFDKGGKKVKRGASKYLKENSKEETNGEIGQNVEILLRNAIVRVPDILNGIFVTAEQLSEPLINFLHNSPYTNKLEGYVKDKVNLLATEFVEKAEKKFQEDLKKMFMGDSTQKNDHGNIISKTNGFVGNNLSGLLNVLFKSFTNGKGNNEPVGSNNPANDAETNDGSVDNILGNIGSFLYRTFESDNGTKESGTPKNATTKNEEITSDDINKILGFVGNIANDFGQNTSDLENKKQVKNGTSKEETHKEKLNSHNVTSKLGVTKKMNNNIVLEKTENPKNEIGRYLNKMIYFR